MRFLFDTQLVIWAAYEPARMPQLMRELLDNVEVVPVVSVVTIWEVAIKAAKHRTFLAQPHALHRALTRHGWEELTLLVPHALAVANLPPIHHDPFDRILIAQATAEGMLLLTSDRTLASYPGPVRLV